MDEFACLDMDMLIALVKERHTLWDNNMELYKNRQATQTAWNEITMALKPGLESDSEKQAYEIIVRKKWRYLRDQFFVELSKIHKSFEGSYNPKWPYFKSLLFLKEVVRNRKYTTKRKKKRASRRSPSESSDQNDDTDGEVPHISYQLTDDSINDPLEKEENAKPPKMLKYSNNVLQYEQKHESTEDDNEHIYFFRSLLPHIALIPRHRLLSFRSRIQELVEEYAYSPKNEPD